MLASWCGAVNGGRAEQPVARLEGAGERVHRRQLEGLLGVEVGQQAGDPLGDAGLARALGPRQQQVVAAGGGDLDGVAGVLHAGQVGEVDVVEAVGAAPGQQPACRTSRRPAAPRGPARRAARPRPGPASAARAPRRPGTIAASARLRLGHDAPGGSRAGPRPEHHRQDAGHRAQAAGQRQLADRTAVPVEERRAPRRWRRARPRRWPGRSGCRAWAGRRATAGSSCAGWRASRGRLLTTAMRHRSRASLRDGVGAPDQDGGDLPGRDVGLDVDQVADGAVSATVWARGERHQPSPRTWSSTAGPRRGRSTATRSTRTSSRCDVVLLGPAPDQPLQPVELGVVDGLVRRAAPSAAPGLDLARDQHAPSRSTRSSSPSAQRQLRSSRVMPARPVSSRAATLLAVGAQRLRLARGRGLSSSHRCTSWGPACGRRGRGGGLEGGAVDDGGVRLWT